MAKIMILTDSCCDIPKETIEELGIKVLPFTLTVSGESFREIYDKSTPGGLRAYGSDRRDSQTLPDIPCNL